MFLLFSKITFLIHNTILITMSQDEKYANDYADKVTHLERAFLIS